MAGHGRPHGFKHSEKTKQKQREAARERWKSPEEHEKHSVNCLGRIPWNKGRAWTKEERKRVGSKAGVPKPWSQERLDGAKSRKKTHCIHGHEYTPENTYIPKNKPNARACRVCRDSKNKARGKSKWLISKYGIDENQFLAMIESQGGVCALCGLPETRERRGRFCVDHCHITLRFAE